MAGYLGNIPTPQATQTRDTFTATSGQTSFATSGYTVGMLDIYLNGIKLASADFTATNGSDVVLASGASTGDILEVVSFSTFETNSGVFTGDFSVDSPTFKVDSSNNRVGIGTASPTAGTLHITGDSTTDQVIIENTNTSSSSAPDLVLHRKSTSSAADGDGVGRIDFRGLNDANEDINYSTIFSKISDASDGTEDGEITIQQIKNGSYVEQLKLTGTHVIHNDGSGNARFGIDNDNQLLIDEDTEAAMYLNGNTVFYVEPDGKQTIYGNVASYALNVFNDGDNTNRSGIRVKIGKDDASGTNVVLAIDDGDGSGQGSITFSGGTVSYNAFTAGHEVSLPDADNANGYPYGTLLETTLVYYKTNNAGASLERGIRYVVQKSSTKYSRKLLGTYSGKVTNVDMLPQSGTYANNLHQAEVLGDGHILCNGSGGNIKVGDGICASATAGIGQKADKLCMIIGIAQKDITFSGSETVLVPVQYGLQQFTPWTD
ncbi:MAG: hypothetical protein Tp139DCM904402_42 [Prokaryotic dsDNA virus sp.]|jgi:hypothetical protein|nr:MAG: hypothetical protein Tp139DCM904402_42 [Prokaryotic dsDNA virus sp.]|tara:strand:- start:8320 stop:9786 length:1467 start_codon:yes stop_codon:yes gene_type:complete